MSRRVCILHPGYKPRDILFMLPAVDGDERDHVHYPTLWVACSIILNNRSDHWLSISRTGTPQASAAVDGLLAAGDYFLHVPGSEVENTQPYPIVPNFRAWQFPHNDLPELWRAASRNDELLALQEDFTLDLVVSEKCRVTERKLCAQEAHIVPKGEKSWFVSNSMLVYGPIATRSGETMADMLSNKMRLRSDAHMLWDRCDFSIIPRVTSGGAAWYTQVMNEGQELKQYWHGNALLPLCGRSVQYLYARYAYNIFPKLHSFLQGKRALFLVVCQADGKIDERQFSEQDCRKFTVEQGRYRSASSKKRSKSQANTPDEEDDAHELRYRGLFGDYFSADSAVSGFRDKKQRSNNGTLDTGLSHSSDSEDHERGRKRWRAF